VLLLLPLLLLLLTVSLSMQTVRSQHYRVAYGGGFGGN